MLGVVVGGPLVDAFGWRAIFVIQTPIAIASLVIGFVVLPRSSRGERQKFDIAGAALLAGGVGSFLVALNRGPEMGWTSPLVLGAFLMGPVLLAGFVMAERRAVSPLLPLRYFRNRNFSFPITNQFLANFTYMGGFILTPLLLHEVLGYSTTKTGLVSIVRPLAFSIVGPIAGYLVIRLGERVIGVFGSLVLALSMVGLAAVTASSSLLWIEVALILSGIGMGACAPAMIASVANAVDNRDLGVAGAASQTMSQVGVVAGMQILLTVQATTEAAHGVRSYAIAYYVGCGVALAAAVAAGFVRRTRHAEPAPAAAATACEGPGSGLGDVADGLGDGHGLLVGLGPARTRGPEGHELGDVALHLDPAGHERLHGGGDVEVDEEGLGHVVLDGDGEVGAVEMTVLDDDLAVGGVDVGLDVAAIEGAGGHHEVHLHQPDRGHLGMRHLVADALGGVHPVVAEEGVLLGHGPS